MPHGTKAPAAGHASRQPRQTDEGGTGEECRYVVRVTDSVPGLPLRVPNELAHLFATTHNNSYVHREYPITFKTDASSSSIMKRDSWNYTLLIQCNAHQPWFDFPHRGQPVSLSPLNDSLRLTLPSPQLTLLAAHADDTAEARVIDSAVPASPTVLTLSLYYAPASVSLYDALGLSLACMAAILVCHFLAAGRLDKAIRVREERVKQKKAATHVVEQSFPPTAAPVDNLADSATPALPDDAASSSSPSSAPTPYRFKAKDTRKRFTRPQPGGGSMDF
ncbi:uncharacterized protein ACA1_092620 [Acanthamoeba castellanii str. Neff]|uniref:Uncharacterized protein n=1 Tax=Acanthamoeba castellanii (strain ATCC 30010 / Neff) TaxID=1257118 RepID=L8GIQ4_ACACF|nr:uncharacterized protein ACA1_092620 [Acanthamoeba castellanii str. Neff]ELR12729.1 hypothetical protein ACA1_092620 [Acanthamoeba castellanii str. Neff]